MKQWRVGTLSMGISLILFGGVLFFSQFKGLKAFEALMDWWPVLFILLGLELLVYLAVSRSAQQAVKYDIFSILFVGFLCIVGLGGAVLASTGFMQEIRYAVSGVERSAVLPDVDREVPGAVERVVVLNRSGSEIVVEQTDAPSLHVFGSYRYTDYGEELEALNGESIVRVRTIGDTMYVEIDQPAKRDGLRYTHSRMHVTVVVPERVQVVT